MCPRSSLFWLAAVVVAACTSGDAGPEPRFTPARAFSAVTDSDGAVDLGEGLRRSQVMVLDAQTHRPVGGARIHAVAAGMGIWCR
jgi:hypothetical protein